MAKIATFKSSACLAPILLDIVMTSKLKSGRPPVTSYEGVPRVLIVKLYFALVTRAKFVKIVKWPKWSE